LQSFELHVHIKFSLSFSIHVIHQIWIFCCFLLIFQIIWTGCMWQMKNRKHFYLGFDEYTSEKQNSNKFYGSWPGLKIQDLSKNSCYFDFWINLSAFFGYTQNQKDHFVDSKHAQTSSIDPNFN
jgi:hypothetical protein